MGHVMRGIGILTNILEKIVGKGVAQYGEKGDVKKRRRI